MKTLMWYPGLPQAATTPIIAMTANVFKEDIEKCMDAGMNGHLGKPIIINDIIKTLAHYLKTRDKPNATP